MLSYNKKLFLNFMALSLCVGVVLWIFDSYARSYNYSVKAVHRYFNKDESQLVNIGKAVEVWITIKPELRVYSAYYDHRRDTSGRVQILAFERVETSTSRRHVYCFFHYGDRTLCLQQPAERTLFRSYDDREDLKNEHYFNPVMYSCGLLGAQIPKAVSLSHDKHCASKMSEHSWMNVRYDKWSSMLKFGVCVHSPLFDINDHRFVAGFIELNRILGAQWFMLYIHSASVSVRKLLRSYQADGLVEVAENWGKNLPKVRYYGQDLSVQDCLYRNMYRVRYLAFVDLDEIILPTRHANWRSMMKEIDNKRTAFYFHHVALFNNSIDPKISKLQRRYGSCDENNTLVEAPRFLSYTIRSKRYNKNRAKFIVKPLAVRALKIHQVLAFVEKRNKSTLVDANVAAVYHYRLNGLDKFQRKTLEFHKLNRFAPKLFTSLRKRLCNFKL